MTNAMALKKRANDNFTRLGRHNIRIVNLVRAQTAEGCDLSVVMDTLDRYYEVAYPDVYEALQRFPDIRRKCAERVLESGITLRITPNTALELDMERILERVCELTSTGGA